MGKKKLYISGVYGIRTKYAMLVLKKRNLEKIKAFVINKTCDQATAFLCAVQTKIQQIIYIFFSRAIWTKIQQIIYIYFFLVQCRLKSNKLYLFSLVQHRL